MHIDLECCGISKLGGRGQVVIPAEARKKLGLKRGEKLFVFCRGKDALVLVKAVSMKSILAKAETEISKFTKIINQPK